MQVETLVAPHITDSDFAQLAALYCLVFPSPDRDEQTYEAHMRRTWQDHTQPVELQPRRFVIREAGRIVANANLFPRRIMTSGGERLIAALATVMSHPDLRGRGFGRAVVRAVFDCVDRGEFPFSLFQTGEAREFYEKLDCRVVTQPIVNSRHPDAPGMNPFTDRWVMCYLSAGELPEGQIDLLGPGY